MHLLVILIIIMSNLIEILDNITRFLNANNIKFVIGGGVAINFLCQKYSFDKIFKINNLDIFYLANTPIASSFIGDYKRVQDVLCRSSTYSTKDGFKINMTMTRSNSMRYIEFNNMKLMHPSNLISYYNEVFSFEEINIDKINTLNNIIDNVSKHPSMYINKIEYQRFDNESRTSTNGEPLARRLFVGY